MKPIAILSFLAATGCAAVVPIGPAGPDPSPTIIGEGETPTNEIIVFRPAEVGFITNVGTSPAILLGERSLGTCRIGAPIIIRVPAGDWTVTALTQSGQVSEVVSVGEGDTKHLRCGTESLPSLISAPTLEPVGADIASREAGL